MRAAYTLTVVASLFISGAALAQGAAPVGECDLLMAHAPDPDKVSSGIRSRKETDPSKSVDVCRKAVEQYPDEARLRYQLGASLFYRAKAGDVAEALEQLRAASDRNYRQATFVLGYIYSINDKVPQDLCRAGHMWQRTLSQGHPWSKYWFSLHYLKGDFKSCTFAVSDAEIDRYVMSFDALDLDKNAEARTAELVALLKKVR